MKPLRAFAYSLVVCGLVSTAFAQSRPKLVLVISIDQFRGDYINRFSNLYLPAKTKDGVGGFKYLLSNGAYYADAHHAHLPTATGPGHASILTGSGPAVNGIAGNQWYDRTGEGRIAYCVEDPLSKGVGGATAPMSARNLLCTTVGDELKMATNGQAKVVGIAYKDRAAILMAGHAANTVLWFDPKVGWVTSDYYSAQLPAWVTEWNDRKLPQADMEESWTPLLSDDSYAMSRPMPGAPTGQHPVFSHPAKNDWIGSSFGQEHMFQTVKLALDKEGLGKDDIPDLLAINLSSNDYIGHTYGPNSPEVLDITVRTDRLLSDLFNTIDKTVGLKNTVIALTGDHGVVPIVEEARDVYKLPAMRVGFGDIVKGVDAALDAKYGAGDWVATFLEGNLYLKHKTVSDAKLSLDEVQDAAAAAAMDVTGVHYAISGHRILTGQVPAWDWIRILTRNYNARLSGDVVVVLAPGNYAAGGTGTGHFSPWDYDSHVPVVLCGLGITPGRYSRRVLVPSIAPTLSLLLGIEFPSGNMAEPLYEALNGNR